MTAKTKRKNFNISAIAVTDASQGGAASLMNDPLLLKALKENRKLTTEQHDLLLEIGMTESDINKALMSDKNTPLSSPEEGKDGEGENVNKGTDEIMSEEILKKLEKIEKENAILKVEKSLSGYEFGEIETELAEALVSVEDISPIIKAFELLLDRTEEAITKAKEEAESELKKSLGDEGYQELKKALEEEAGEEGAGAEGEGVEKSNKDKFGEEYTRLMEKAEGGKA